MVCYRSLCPAHVLVGARQILLVVGGGGGDGGNNCTIKMIVIILRVSVKLHVLQTAFHTHWFTSSPPQQGEAALATIMPSERCCCLTELTPHPVHCAVCLDASQDAGRPNSPTLNNA